MIIGVVLYLHTELLQGGNHSFSDMKGFFEVGIAGKNEMIETSLLVITDTRGDFFVGTHEGCACPTAD